MNITVKYFASIRESVGKSQEVRTTNAHDLKELYCELADEYQLDADIEHLRVACNQEYVPFSHPLKNMDTIAFIPPVSGG